MLHQKDEPGDLPIKLTGLGVTAADFGPHLCMVFGGGGGEDKIFSNESLVNSIVPRRPRQGFVTSYCSTLGRTA